MRTLPLISFLLALILVSVSIFKFATASDPLQEGFYQALCFVGIIWIFRSIHWKID